MILLRKKNFKLFSVIKLENILLTRFVSKQKIDDEKTKKNLNYLKSYLDERKKKILSRVKKTEKIKDENILSINKENQFKKLNELILPYESIDYDKQINFKKENLYSVLNQLIKKCQDLDSTFVKGTDGYPCVIDIISSNKIKEYQFQNLFLINKDVEGKIAVGFNLGNFKNGLITVRPNNFIVCKETHQYLANGFEHYLKNISQFKVCFDHNSNLGNWISFLVRSNNKNEHQCILKLRKLNLKNENINKEKMLLKGFFENLNVNIKSFYLEEIETTYDVENKKKKLISQFNLIFGRKTLQLEFLNKNFDILPKTLVPINIKAYECIIEKILEDLIQNKNQNLILMNNFSHLFIPFLSENFKKTYIMEKKTSSNSSKQTSIIYKNKNTKSLFEVIDTNLEDISIICDPEDISLRIINDLRKDKFLKKIFFITTDLKDDLVKKIIFLCLTNKNKEILGKPFNLIRSTLVDSHPLTKKFTSIYYLERV